MKLAICIALGTALSLGLACGVHIERRRVARQTLEAQAEIVRLEAAVSECGTGRDVFKFALERCVAAASVNFDEADEAITAGECRLKLASCKELSQEAVLEVARCRKARAPIKITTPALPSSGL